MRGAELLKKGVSHVMDAIVRSGSPGPAEESNPLQASPKTSTESLRQSLSGLPADPPERVKNRRLRVQTHLFLTPETHFDSEGGGGAAGSPERLHQALFFSFLASHGEICPPTWVIHMATHRPAHNTRRSTWISCMAFFKRLNAKSMWIGVCCGLVCGSPCGSPMWGASSAMPC